MKKKEKYIEYTGMFHNATDYAVYHMRKADVVIGGLVGALLSGVVVHIFFSMIVLTIISVPLGFFGGIFVYRGMLLNKRKNILHEQSV